MFVVVTTLSLAITSCGSAEKEDITASEQIEQVEELDEIKINEEEVEEIEFYEFPEEFEVVE